MNPYLNGIYGGIVQKLTKKKKNCFINYVNYITSSKSHYFYN